MKQIRFKTMKQYLQQRKGLVQGVFNSVYDKYDVMNRFMSLVRIEFGKEFSFYFKSSKNKSLIDVREQDIKNLYVPQIMMLMRALIQI